jgi:FlaA1/EpsC-like NDP-sugar epimerase
MNTRDNMRNATLYFGDLFFVVWGFWGGILLYGVWDMLKWPNAMFYTAVIVILYNIAFFTLKYYKDSIYFFDYFAVARLGLSIFFIYSVLALVMTVRGFFVEIRVIAGCFIVSCFLSGSYRILLIIIMNLLYRYLKAFRKKGVTNIIVFGAGDAGRFLENMLTYDKTKRMRVVAFIDDNPALHGKKVRGCPIYGGRESVSEAVAKFKADEIIIAIPHVDNSTFREIVELCCQSGARVRRFANMSDLHITDLSKATINEIEIDDLLGRAPVSFHLSGVAEMLYGKVVLISGGAGSIGSEICRQVLGFDIRKLVIFDMNENGLFMLGNELNRKYKGKFETVVGSIKDKVRIDEIMQIYRPQVVFHAAAYKHVPMMECNPIESIANNVFGTENLMLSAIEYNVERFTIISTDKAVNPTNIMGATKRITELMCKYMNSISNTTRFSAVRFGNVLGSNGSVIPLFQEQIRMGGPITVTDMDIQRYFMTIPEAVQLVLEASSFSKGGELFVLDMGEMIKIYDLATTMIRLSGLQPEKDIKIEIVGLRPGEKLYEELHFDTESLHKTDNERIFLFMSDNVDFERFKSDFDKLRAGFQARKMGRILEQMKRLIPSYAESEYIQQHNE